jgi:hypothetical protein
MTSLHRSLTPSMNPAAVLPAVVGEEPGNHWAGPILITTPWGVHAIPTGQVIVGRGDAVHITLPEALVSRRHARLTVSADRVWVEDLGSANGTRVNGSLVTEKTALREGDSLHLATVTISVRRLVAPRLSTAKAEQELGRIALLRTARERTREIEAPNLPGRSEESVTERADAFDVLGRLAERLLASGQIERAEHIVSEFLAQVRGGVRSGLTLPVAVRERAAGLALKLLEATGKAHFAESLVELHVTAKTMLSKDEFGRLSRALAPSLLRADLVQDYCEILGHALRGEARSQDALLQLRAFFPPDS